MLDKSILYFLCIKNIPGLGFLQLQPSSQSDVDRHIYLLYNCHNRLSRGPLFREFDLIYCRSFFFLAIPVWFEIMITLKFCKLRFFNSSRMLGHPFPFIPTFYIISSFALTLITHLYRLKQIFFYF